MVQGPFDGLESDVGFSGAGGRGDQNICPVEKLKSFHLKGIGNEGLRPWNTDAVEHGTKVPVNPKRKGPF
jgi:hypothetical protein